eukprot:1689314-Karenia_brevis.AAC.1
MSPSDAPGLRPPLLSATVMIATVQKTHHEVFGNLGCQFVPVAPYVCILDIALYNVHSPWP